MRAGTTRPRARAYTTITLRPGQGLAMQAGGPGARNGCVGQRSAGAELSRYRLAWLVPARAESGRKRFGRRQVAVDGAI